MIACKDCGKQISPDAMQCPQCGANVANSPYKVLVRALFIIPLVAFFWWVLGG